jgi:hypothetical protein
VARDTEQPDHLVGGCKKAAQGQGGQWRCGPVTMSGTTPRVLVEHAGGCSVRLVKQKPTI